MQRPLIIGSRGSPLALCQARYVQKQLCAAHKRDKNAFPIQTFTTSGDRLKGKLQDFGGKGLFTKELEQALLAGKIDVAVHSMKDVPTTHQPGLSIAAVLERGDVRDGLISPHGFDLQTLPQGACIGTASVRRRAQLLALRSDLTFNILRGNVQTRLKKLQGDGCMATLLACAGLDRLKLAHIKLLRLSPEIMLPAPAQGVIGLETRHDDSVVRDCVGVMNHQKTRLTMIAERAFLQTLDGSCQTPIAALACFEDDDLYMRGELLSEDGQQRWQQAVRTPCVDMNMAVHIGQALASSIRVTPVRHHE